MINELLSPDTLAPALQKKLTQLNAALLQLKKSQKNQPPGHLRIAQKSATRNYFYHYTTPDDFNGKYIRKNQQALAKALAQKDYNLKLIKQLEKETQSLNEYLMQSKNGTAIQSLYKDLCPARQPLITPATLTDEQYTSLWKSITWQGLPFPQDAPQYDTAQGEKVRSNSEVIIADALARHGIPYRYEFPLKLQRIEKNNIFPGRNLIITMETKDEPLNTKLIEKIIFAFLKS